MNNSSCPVCTTNTSVLLFTVNRYSIVRCKQCTFVYVSNAPSQKQLDAFYSKKDYTDASSAEKIIRQDAVRSLDTIEQYTDEKELFDVGCGRGYFLDEARKKQWTGSGLDYSSDVIRHATKMLHLTVSQGDIHTYKTKEKHAVVSLNQVIEHFVKPAELLLACKNVLQENGLLYIATPNIDCLSATIFKEQFDYMIPPEHLTFFSPTTLKLLLEQQGFEVLFIGTWSYPAEFAGILKYYAKHVIGRKKMSTLETMKQVNNIPTNLQSMAKTLSLGKKLKRFFFDDIFCSLFHSVLDIFSRGSMLHVVARKR